MALAPGSRLGAFEVLAQIGVGGMGEVYKATDTNLKRSVAIKVLPASVSGDAERLARFQREAEVLAALNHPNIAAIYGLERSGTMTALVMELVEGPTLADRIAQGAIPVDEALPIAQQIAEALEAAHEQGIIHRDLKPANIKVRTDGTVKVLDFGLAKAMDNVGRVLGPAGGAGSKDPAYVAPSQSPTITTPAMTQAGVILGTAAYMSPEQARGKTVDKRTDMWAFGCVLYEMLTGTRAFAGEGITDILASVVKTEPDWSRLPESTPPTVRTVLRRCLRKDQQRRLADAGAVRIEIEDGLTVSETPPVAVAGPGRGRWQAVVVALVLMLAAGITAFALWKRPPSPLPVVRTMITLPPGEQLAGEGQTAVALSPDGNVLAYAAVRDGSQRIFLRAMDSFETKLVPGSDGAASPFFSPDGQWLGFFADGKLKKISLNGRTAETLADAVNPRGASWGSQRTIIFAPTNSSPLLRIAETGGAPQPLPLGREPELLPGGATVLFEVGGRIDGRVLETGAQRNLVRAGTHPRYAASGHLVYAQGGNLMAVPFDPQQLAIKGRAALVVEDVLQYQSTGAAQYSISGTGTLVYVSGKIQLTQSRLVWVTRGGMERPLAAPARAYMRPRLSPDERKIALSLDGQVWLYDPSNETLTRSTFEGSGNNFPLWAPDGKRIVFNSSKEGPLNLFWQFSDGSGGLERLATSDYTQAAMSWSQDGQFLAFTEISPATGYDIWVLRLSDHKAVPFLRTSFMEAAPQFSPDGRWMAYCSDESGRFEIYVQPFPGPGGKWQISAEGGTEPMWNRNGRELFYRSGERMMAVDVTGQSGFASGRPRVLFDGQYQPSPYPNINYDVSSDGQRFLMLKRTEQQDAAVTQINVVQNWSEELKRLVPTR